MENPPSTISDEEIQETANMLFRKIGVRALLSLGNSSTFNASAIRKEDGTVAITLKVGERIFEGNDLDELAESVIEAVERTRERG